MKTFDIKKEKLECTTVQTVIFVCPKPVIDHYMKLSKFSILKI